MPFKKSATYRADFFYSGNTLENTGIVAAYGRTLANAADLNRGCSSHTTFNRFLPGFAKTGNLDLCKTQLF